MNDRTLLILVVAVGGFLYWKSTQKPAGNSLPNTTANPNVGSTQKANPDTFAQLMGLLQTGADIVRDSIQAQSSPSTQ
jgi:hypothetical protein